MVSLNWVKDYIDIEDKDLKELAVEVTKAGINVEKVVTNKIDHLVIGEIVECIDHPDSDHLHVCQVNVGEEVKQIVCGADNVRKGIKVIVALPGAVLPGDFEIKKGKIRGEVSEGMICALFELNLEEKTEENYNRGIEELDADAPVGQDPISYLGLDDTLYELDVHKHRNNDCYYHIGFAYEIGAVLNRKVTLPVAKYNEVSEDIKDNFSLEVETSKCPYYLAKMVKDVTIKESPEFIQKRLAAVGMRSINNVVDISNYVMLEYGQPMHFFDKDKLGNKIVVRDAKDNEEITTLDDNLRVLNTSDIVITDSKKAVCIAGVMGGQNTEVDESTKNILIESAIFDAVTTRNTAARLDLRSEASIRYGKGLSYEYTNEAIERACSLLEEYADAKVLTGIVKHDNVDKSENKITFETKELNKMLGIELTDEDVKIELERLDFEYSFDNNNFETIVPKRRLDIENNVNDLAEEIGRLYGYHNLKSTLPNVKIKKGEYKGDIKYRKIISKRLRSLGLNEAKTYTLVSPEMNDLFNYDNKEVVVLPNPMSIDKSIIRTSLIASLLNTYEYNKARKVKDINIYEISKTYDKEYNEVSKIAGLLSGNYINSTWGNANVKVDFYLVKGIIENLLDYLGLKNRYSFEVDDIKSLHPGISAKIVLDREDIGVIGKIHPGVLKDDVYVFELSLNKLMKKIKPIKHKEGSKYPSIQKDLAFVVKKDVESRVIETQIKKSGSRLLNSISLFDIYVGDNVEQDEKSLAYSLSFKDDTKTLTEEEVTEVFNKIINDVETRCNAKLRSN